MSLSQYMQLGDKWCHSYKEGNRPIYDPYSIGWLYEPSEWALEQLEAKGMSWKGEVLV
jgi:hypothetical protein